MSTPDTDARAGAPTGPADGAVGGSVAGTVAILGRPNVGKVKDKSALLPLLSDWEQVSDFRALVPISALKNKNLAPLVTELAKLLPRGAPLYGPETLTDRTERFLAAELIREQIFLLTR